MNYLQPGFGSGLLFLATAICLVPACMQQQDSESAPMQTSILLYREQEAGTAVYPVRILINAGHVRLDDGQDDGDFILLERKSRTIYSVSHEEGSILVMDAPVVDRRQPVDLNITLEQEAAAGAPLVAGVQPLDVRVMANNETCIQAVVVPGWLPAATAGLIDYAQALGDRQLDVLDTVPQSVQTPCYLARYAYAAAHHLRQGLPIQEWDGSGYRRELVDFKDQQTMAPALFSLPPDYEHIRINIAG